MENEYTIKIGKQEVKASEYQNKIFDEIEHGVNNLVVNAAAGSSKTTTIVNAIKYIPTEKKILFVAFNKDIVKKIKESITHENSTVLTFHGLGYILLKENKIINTAKKYDVVDDNKYRKYVSVNYDSLTSTTACNVYGKRRKTFFNNIMNLIDYARYYLAFREDEIIRIAELYDITLLANEAEIVRKALLWGKEHTETIDYTDMLWLPNVLNLATKKYRFNFVFVDEAQDTNIAEQELVKKTFKRGCRFCVVCDTFQQINIWAGSTMDAINNFKNLPNTKVYRLPISYRCPKKVVELAKEYSNNIIAADNAIDGEIRYDVDKMEPTDGDLVLCRRTAPLITLFMKYINSNKPCYVRGYENIKQSYLSLIASSNSSLIDKNCLTSDGLFPKLYSQLIGDINMIEHSYNVPFDEALNHSSIVEKYDEINAIKGLCDGIITTDELIQRINSIFSNISYDGVCLSTIHKAKGLEADNVYILEPSLLKDENIKKEWEKFSERNVIYVAYTRAKKSLNFIKDDNSHLFGCVNTKKLMVDDISSVSDKLNFNIKNKITENKIASNTKKKTSNNILGKNEKKGNKNKPKKKKTPLSKFKLFES